MILLDFNMLSGMRKRACLFRSTDPGLSDLDIQYIIEAVNAFPPTNQA